MMCSIGFIGLFRSSSRAYELGGASCERWKPDGSLSSPDRIRGDHCVMLNRPWGLQIPASDTRRPAPADAS
jgi:hypothetical protein